MKLKGKSMNLIEQLKLDLKLSLKSGDGVKKNIVRLVLSEIAAEDSRRTSVNRLDDEGRLSIINKMKKGLTETLEIYRGADDTAENKQSIESLEKEIIVLTFYLPSLMNKEETGKAVETIIAQVGAESMQDFGKVMGSFSKAYKGKADNKIASSIIKEKLA